MNDHVDSEGIPSYESLEMYGLYEKYPRNNFPDTLKPPSAKSKLSKINDFEHILDDYDDEARNVAFRVSASRLPYWVRALRIFLYDFVGQKRMHEVSWLDDPNPSNLQHIFIEVHSKSTTASNTGMLLQTYIVHEDRFYNCSGNQ